MGDTKTIYITVTPPTAGFSNTGSDISSTSSNTAEAGSSDIPSSLSDTSQPEFVVDITSTATGGSITTTTDAEFSNTISTSLATSSATSKATPLYTTEKGLSTGAKAGIAVGVLLGVLLLLFVAFFFHSRRRKRRRITKGVPVLPELGTDGQKHELSPEESRRAELAADEQTNINSNSCELE
ncbi:hypothetical protein N7488_009173 [Penicillium malachiteum]|nr:hypothetical protein N7488_009173 [Penicillium malachiteum]